jgi:hypothetical protein
MLIFIKLIYYIQSILQSFIKEREEKKRKEEKTETKKTNREKEERENTERVKSGVEREETYT